MALCSKTSKRCSTTSQLRYKGVVLARHQLWLITAVFFALFAAACSSSSDAVAAGEDAPTEAATVEQSETDGAPAEDAPPEDTSPETTVAPETTTTETTTTPTTAPPETSPPETEPVLAASPLFAGDFVDLSGQAIDFGSFEGQDTVLWFWAPW